MMNVKMYKGLIYKIYTVGIALGYGLRIFLFTTASRKALGPTQPPIQ
jgi:hypothetical protein